MKTIRNYTAWLNRIRAVVGGDRLAGDLPFGDHVQPVVLVDDVRQLVSPLAVTTCYGGHNEPGVALQRAGIGVTPGPGCGGLVVVTVSASSATETCQFGLVDGSPLAYFNGATSAAYTPGLVSEGPSRAIFAAGTRTPPGITNYFQLGVGQRIETMAVFVRPGRSFMILNNVAGTNFAGGLAWYELPPQPVPPAE